MNELTVHPEGEGRKGVLEPVTEAVGKQTRHGGQTRITISSPHARADWAQAACRRMATFFKDLMETAEQLTPTQRWYRILSQALVKYLRGRQLRPPDPLPAPG